MSLVLTLTAAPTVPEKMMIAAKPSATAFTLTPKPFVVVIRTPFLPVVPGTGDFDPADFDPSDFNT